MTHVFTTINMYDILKEDNNNNNKIENKIIPITVHNNDKIDFDQKNEFDFDFDQNNKIYNHCNYENKDDYNLNGISNFSKRYENDFKKDDWQYIIRLKYNNLDKYIKNSIVNHSHPIPIKYSSFQTLKVFNNIINQYYRKNVNITKDIKKSIKYKYESTVIRKINNFVKFTTYYEFLSKLPPNPFIISIGEGRGQDLGKYERFYPCRTLIIDLVESALDICELRWNKVNNPYPLSIVQFDFTCNFNINLYSYIWFCNINNEKQYQKNKYCVRYDLYKKNKKRIKKRINNSEKKEKLLQINNNNANINSSSNSISSSSSSSSRSSVDDSLSNDDNNYKHTDDDNYIDNNYKPYNLNKRIKIYDNKEDFTCNPRFINCQFAAQYAYKDEISSKNFWNHIKNLSSHTVPGGTLLIISIPNLNTLVNLISKNVKKQPGSRSIGNGPLYIKELNNVPIEKHKSYVAYRFVMHKTLDVVEYTVDSKQLVNDALHHGFYLIEKSNFIKRYNKYGKDEFFEIVKKNMGLNNDDEINKIYLNENNMYKMFVFYTSKKFD